MSSKRRRKPGAKGGGNQHKQPEVRDFWGEEFDAELIPLRPIVPSHDPSTMVRSLGAPPLGARDAAAEHYFAAVYDRATGLAMALAATADLLEFETEE